jgi:DNA primase
MDGGKPKYVASGERHLFNAAALDTADTTGEVAITEGELDAIVATELFGVPAVGVPGATQWDQHGRSWRRLFEGYQRIWILADPDKAGLELAEKLLESLKQARLVKLPGDVTETYLKGLNLRDLMT